jgi:hypothetical protein
MSEGSIKMNQDEEHLKLLSIFHYVAGGITGIIACFPIMHLFMGLVVLVAGLGEASVDEKFPVLLISLMFILIPGFIILCGWSLAVCLIITGSFLAQRKHYTFCFVVACISCLLMPYGTVLGVFTIIVLMRPTVKQLLAVNP